MNVHPGPNATIPAGFWERDDVHPALATRNMASLFRSLQRSGVSQRQIASLTGQSQSEISEIIKGRQVMAYDLLARISDGLGIPRGYLGLAFSADQPQRGAGAAVGFSGDRDGRESLAHAAQVVVDGAALHVESWTRPLPLATAAVPARIGAADVDRLRSIAAGLRALDRRFGGGFCRDAVVAQVRWAQQLLKSKQDEAVRRQLHLTLAEMHNLAGWTSFDVGLGNAAKEHFIRALEQARYVNEPSLMAKALYCLGRLHLHHGLVVEALKFFQLGQMAAQESGSELATAMLCANEAWAYGLLGDEAQVTKSADRAKDEFTRAKIAETPSWISFFTIADLHACIAMAEAFLPQPSPRHRQAAISGLQQSLAARAGDMARSRAFELTALAMVHLRNGDFDQGALVGRSAVDAAEEVRSTRVLDRLKPLAAEAQRHPRHAEVLDLAERIATLRAV